VCNFACNSAHITISSQSAPLFSTLLRCLCFRMPSEKESHSKKKPKSDDSKPVQKTSDDILASLFNDLESTGQVSDFR
jgi:hypothetical protein